MKTKRIVITGGPGTGKSSLIHKLEAGGHECLHEISRQVTLEAQKQGIDQLFLEKPVLFSEKLLQGRMLQYREAAILSAENVFIDRGIPDVLAYMHFFNTEFPPLFIDVCKEHPYDEVFILPPWKEIYKSDNERYESFEEAQRIYVSLLKTYRHFGYAPIEVPKGTLQNRIDFILDHI